MQNVMYCSNKTNESIKIDKNTIKETNNFISLKDLDEYNIIIIISGSSIMMNIIFIIMMIKNCCNSNYDKVNESYHNINL
jgi:hypothetical protein